MTKRRPAVFLDRDGTLNVEQSYITRPEQMRLLGGVGEALQLLRGAGFACVVVTNQSAVGRGMIGQQDLQRIHEEMHRQLAACGAQLDGIYYCPAAPNSLEADHPERKPAPGMLLRAARELNLDLASSWMIGDKLHDIQAGQNAGCRGCIFVRTGHPLRDETLAEIPAFHIADDLLAAARYIVEATTKSLKQN